MTHKNYPVQQKSFEALVQLTRDDPRHAKGVYIDTWRDAAYSAGITPSSKKEAKRKAFQRAVENLREGGYVETSDDFWWPKRDK